MGDLISRADVEDALAPEDYVALFDRDRDGAVSSPADLARVDKAIAVGESTLLMLTKAAYPGGFSSAGGTVDEAIKAHVVAFAVHHAIRFSPLATGNASAPYRQAYLDAMAFAKALARDDNARPVTANAGEPYPRAESVGIVNADGDPVDSWARNARGADASDF